MLPPCEDNHSLKMYISISCENNVVRQLPLCAIILPREYIVIYLLWSACMCWCMCTCGCECVHILPGLLTIYVSLCFFAIQTYIVPYAQVLSHHRVLAELIQLQ